jgi:Domain of unknown function (DUF222)/HNH endonuclease
MFYYHRVMEPCGVGQVGPGATESRVASPLTLALDSLATSLDHLVKLTDDCALDDLGPTELVAFLQAVESFRNRLPVVDHAAVQTAIRRDVPHALCQRSMVRVMTQALRISAAEASRRVKAAEHLGDRAATSGERLTPWRAYASAAQREGELTSEQVSVIDTALRRVDGRGFDLADVECGERILVDAARDVGPEDLRHLADRVVDAIDPDGSLPDDQLHRDRRFFHLRRATDGTYRGEFRLTPEVGAKLAAVLDPLAAPSITRFAVGGASEGSDGGRTVTEVDPRTRGQRVHDAVESVCDRLLRAGGLPDSGGTPATVVITIDADDLRDRTGQGLISDGSPLSPQAIVRLADQAEIAWCVKGSTGAVLALGRARRIASRSQTLAMIARDGGCSFPGCSAPPEWSERHHLVPWIDGGTTDLDNLTLLCRYHHHNFEQRGWRCRLNADRLPAWIPPAWIDRDQRPIVHPRILTRRWRTGPAGTGGSDPGESTGSGG